MTPKYRLRSQGWALVEIVTYDFETKAIEGRPVYPPAPVGVSIGYGHAPPRYYGFGHLSGGNNCTEAEARAALEKAWMSGAVMLAHNQKFDCAVATERWGLPMLPWDRMADTMFLIFLLDPHARTTALKPLAQDMLGMPPEEQDEVARWVWANRERILAATGQKVPSAKKTGAFIWCAPGNVVEPYANGDVTRTRRLFDHMMPLVEKYGMVEAYDRERRLMPILMENERVGLRVDIERLAEDTETYQAAFKQVEDELRRFLGATALNFDADADVAEVLLQRGIVPNDNWTTTKSGQFSMSKDNLHPDLFTGPGGAEVASALGYRNRLLTCLRMFMEPWLAQASRTKGGTIHTNWHQTRGAEQGGTRTGRPSTSDPNLLNISKSWDGRDDGYRHPAFLGLPELPLIRTYVLPDEGHTFCHRDFSGQELRIFGHFEKGDLHRQYQENPLLDVHKFVGVELMRVAMREIEHTRVKMLNFQAIYGGGVPALQKKLRCSAAEAKELKNFHDQALPGRKILAEEIKRLVRSGLPISTLGGRLYFPEAPGPDGRSKEYKLTNYLIQGSAADLTKQSIIDWDEMNRSLPLEQQARFLITVYDENNISAPTQYKREHMLELRRIMHTPRLGMTVPMLSDGKWGDSWGTAKKVTDEELGL